MSDRETEILSSDEAGLKSAAMLLRAGDLVAFPTETVYGLGADARNAEAVAKVFRAKQRPSFNPLIVHVASVPMAEEIARFTPLAERVASAFWPGPLTLVLPLREDSGIAAITTAGLSTVAVRIPEKKVAQRLLEHADVPVAAPSANPSGRVSATTAAHVVDGLGGRIAAVLDGGPCEVGLESTIVGLVDVPTLLRPGGLPVEEIEACLGAAIQSRTAVTEQPISPGQMSSHYAPTATLRLNATRAEAGEFLIGFGQTKGDTTLSEAGDLTEAAARLFVLLRDLDDRGIRRAAIASIPETGLGLAINDRLRRAAAPRL